ncbi:MAG: hypothetical protein WBE17_00600 [Anaerolineae bacterium]
MSNPGLVSSLLIFILFTIVVFFVYQPRESFRGLAGWGTAIVILTIYFGLAKEGPVFANTSLFWGAALKPIWIGVGALLGFVIIFKSVQEQLAHIPKELDGFVGLLANLCGILTAYGYLTSRSFNDFIASLSVGLIGGALIHNVLLNE